MLSRRDSTVAASHAFGSILLRPGTMPRSCPARTSTIWVGCVTGAELDQEHLVESEGAEGSEPADGLSTVHQLRTPGWSVATA